MADFVAEESARDLTISGEIGLHVVPGVGRLEAGVERRAKPRIQVAFPSKVWGVDAAGNAFELDCALDNMSSCGVYLKLPKSLVSGDELSLVVSFVNSADPGAKALLRCQVLRTEPTQDGFQGVAAEIKKYQFL